MSQEPETSRGWKLGLLGWMVAAAGLFWLAPRPPPVPLVTAEEEAVWNRTADEAGANARRWQREHGDLRLPWGQARGHLAIVIDDVGRELHLFDQLLGLRHQLTFSVLPRSNYSVGVQLRLRADGRRYREILVHLPMEPTDPAKMIEGAEADEEFLRTTDQAAGLEAKLDEALQRVPAAVGVNNHMGSALTADPDAMQVVMTALHSRGLFFLDSRTTADSVALSAARRHDVPATIRHVFLDNDPSPEAVRTALALAVQRALNEPTVAIAHPSPAVVEVLREQLPLLHSQGIAVYPLSDVVAALRTSPATRND